MRKPRLLALASLVLAGCQAESSVAPTVATPPVKTIIPGSYIVVLKPSNSQFARASMASIVAESGASVEHTYTSALNGFSAIMSDSAAAKLSQRADVALVEPDALVSISNTQTPAPWNLDRLDQTSLPLDNSYTTAASGNGVSIYIIDTGIRTTHSEFGGRAVGAYSVWGDGAVDCNGHGTHVGGTIGGANYGVAKSVKIYAVKVLDCDGSGRVSGVLAGIDWVSQNAIKPAVANMSLGGGISGALDAAVQGSIATGITYAIAAGNSGADACEESPARVPEALTVGASTSDDHRAGFSNTGSCVDLFAPGVDVVSAWNGSDSDTRYASGTSMASPHVAGVAALYLETHRSASPAEVTSALLAAADKGKLQDVGDTQNLLLSTVRDGVAVPPTPVDNPPVAAFSATCVLLSCALDASGSTDDGQIVQYNWAMPGAVVSAAIGAKAAPTYTTSGVKSITLTVTDNTGKTTSLTQTVTIAPINQAPVAQFTGSCTNLACSFDGSSSTDDTGISDYSWTWTGSGSESGSANGAVASFKFPHSGTYIVSLTVRDLNGVTNNLGRTFTATAANQSPAAGISAPANNASVIQGTNITFTGTGTDPEDGTLTSSALVWSSSINGTIGTGASFTTSALSVGTHVITLTVKDAQGASASTSRTVVVTAPNRLPTATIASPSNNSKVMITTIISFVGSGNDAEDGALSGTSLTWSSNINGVIGTGNNFSTDVLSLGTHTITLTAKDSQGATASSSIVVIVGSPNQSPSASIASPVNNSSVLLGTNVTFAGAGTDPEDGALSGASLTWSSNINGVIGTGTSFSTSALSAGTHTITLTVKDAQGATSSTTRTLTVRSPNQSPSTSITSPSNNSNVMVTTIVAFTGTGNDPEDGALNGSSLTWSSNINGVIGTGASFSTGSLSVGTHTITLTARDSQGATATSSIVIVVGAPNQSPSASIASPSNNAQVLLGSSVIFTGNGSDPEDGVLGGSSLTWSSSINGVIGTGTSFATSALTAGTHTITLTVRDAQGATSSTTRTLVVRAPNQSPTASITSPSNNSSVLLTTIVSFTGTAVDPEDGALSGSSLTWSSNIIGVIGTGTSFSTGVLTAGTHTITLTARDSQGASTSTSLTLTVTIPNRAPVAGIGAPGNGSSVQQGSTVRFEGTGSDAEDGSLSGGSLTWSSNLDGNIGTGTAFSTANLSVGTHVITLTAHDAQGLTGSAVVTVVVTAPPVVEIPVPTQPSAPSAPSTPTVVAPVANFTVICPTGGIGRYCRFDATTSTDDIGIVSYSWNFGDGRAETLEAPTKVLVYPRGGSYNVTLTVTDTDGRTASTTRAIVVR